MRTARNVFAAAILAATAGTSLAQTSVTLRLDRVEDLFSLTLNPASGDNAFFVGTALSCIETDGTPNNWFVGGIMGGVPAQPWDAQVVKIEFDLSLPQGDPGFRAFRALPDTRTTAPADGSAEGITGMDYAPGRGLIVGTESRLFEGGKVKVFDVNTQLNPILLASSVSTNGRDGSGGPSWDLGPGGAGVPYQRLVLDAGGQPVLDDLGNRTYEAATAPALVSVIRFGDRGPRASLPTDLDFTANTGATTTFKTAYFAGNGGAFTAAIPGSPMCVLNTTGVNHRDLKIHPETGVIAIRAQADLILASREADGTVLPTKVARVGPTAASGFVTNVAAFVIGERVQMLVGASGGDLVVWNQRETTSAGQAAANVIKFNRLPAVVDEANPDGFGSVTATYVDTDGVTPYTIPAGSGMYDFAWIRSTNQLIILDCNSGVGGSKAYVFTVNPQPTGCPFDYNGDGNLDPDDLADYIACFFEAPPCPQADLNGDGNADPDDLADFIAGFFGGC